MPAIVVKEYIWRQTDDTIVINTPLFGNPKTVDLFAVNNYVKASYPPFILELFLWGTIVDEESECVLNKAQAEIVFNLKKAEFGVTWPSLVVKELDKQTKNERRTRALEQAQELTEKREKTKSEKRQKLQKQAVRAQINLDTAILNKIDMERDTERKEAMKDFEDWRSGAQNPILSDIEGKPQENRKAYRPALKWFKNEEGELKSREMTQAEVLSQGTTVEDETAIALKQFKGNKIKSSEASNLNMRSSLPEMTHPVSNILYNSDEKSKIIRNEQRNNIGDSASSLEDSEIDSDLESSCGSTTEAFIRKINAKRTKKFYKDKTKSENSTGGKLSVGKVLTQRTFKTNVIFDEPKKTVPLPRKNGIIDVKFSERRFPTPARESNQVEEQEWLEKQAEARRQTGFILEDLRPEELDPQWLKDKGDEFFKAGNYLGAISAYSHGIKLSPKMSSLYSNRSAAHYALGNYFRCTEDCSKALELMVPHCKGNLESRAKCHARRGAALCKLSSPQHGIPELEAALKLDPENVTIKRDLKAARQYFDIHE